MTSAPHAESRLFPVIVRALLLATTLLATPAATQSPSAVDEIGISGAVVDPDGKPVSSGRVAMQSFGVSASAPIDANGHFRVVPNNSAPQVVVVNVPGFAPYRVRVAVPRSRALKLPLIRLSPATYFRVRFVSSDGEPILSPRLYRQSFDASGPIAIPQLGDLPFERIDSDGTITIGPLPKGLTTMAIDSPPFAQSRLPDLSVTDEEKRIDGGTVVVQPGAVLHVDVFDAEGAPVPQHEVFIEDVRPLSPLTFRPVRTNQEGRATFERLSAGRYRVRTKAIERCGSEPLAIAPLVAVPARGTVEARLIVDGHATFRIISPALGPMRGIHVTAAPDDASPATVNTLRPRANGPPVGGRTFRGTTCSGGTDSEGRVTLKHFPPGPARVEMHLLNSNFVRRVTVPVDGKEVIVSVPEGFMPVRVTSAPKGDPIAGAAITWTHEGGRVEATASINGDALLDAVGSKGGTLGVSAQGHKSIEELLPEPPATLHEVALVRTPIQNLQIRVVSASGEPLPDAVVAITSLDPMEIPRVAVTDAKGAVTFPDAPLGSLRVTADADGFATAAQRVADDRRAAVVLTLARLPI